MFCSETQTFLHKLFMPLQLLTGLMKIKQRKLTPKILYKNKNVLSRDIPP